MKEYKILHVDSSGVVVMVNRHPTGKAVPLKEALDDLEHWSIVGTLSPGDGRLCLIIMMRDILS